MQAKEVGDVSFKPVQVTIDIEAVERMLREDAEKAEKKSVKDETVVIDFEALERKLQAIGK